MNMKKILLFITCISIFFLQKGLHALRNTHPDNLVDFNFVNTELTDIIQMLAAKEEKNILMPQGAPIKQKINIQISEKITLEKAWEYTIFFLNLAGYTMIPHNGMSMVIKNDANSNRETLPIYVGFNPQEFPRTDNKIRAIIYLKNLKVPEKFTDKDSREPIDMILSDMLSPVKSVVYDTKSNAIIVSDSANRLATALNIIMLLDQSGDPNVVEVVQLFNVNASVVADLLKTQILALTGDTKGALKADVKSETGLYFGSGSVHLIADNRLNSIILTGSESSIERIKELIAELDQPTDSGRSILHIYELQYLEADVFAPALERLVKAGTETAQSTKDLSGSHRKMFEGVLITAESKIKETIRKYEAPTAQGKAGELKSEEIERGGNRLIITARQDDWLRIKELIHSLDIPQPIIIIEVMVIDVSLNEQKILAAQLRNLNAANILKGVTEQSNFLNNPILNTVAGSTGSITVTPEPAKLAADLLSLIFPASTSLLTNQYNYSLAQGLSQSAPGSLIMSFNDPNGSGIWGVLQVLDSYSDLKVLSHPFLVAKNNKPAETIVSDIRRDQGQAFAGQAAVVSQKIEDIEARLRVGVVPRVSSIDRLNLQIAIDVQEFTSVIATNFTRNTRTVNTSANLSSGQVLALGGLTTLTEQETNTRIPILADIPIIGPLFQQNNRIISEINLLILIAPTVIQPKVRGGVELYTREKISSGFDAFEVQSVLGSPRDPVTRWFFKNRGSIEDSKEMANVYLSQARGDFVREFEQEYQQKRDNTKAHRRRRGPKKKEVKPVTQPVDRFAPSKHYKTAAKFGL